MNLYSLSAIDIEGNEITFDQYRGKVVLIVNTASQCGCTHQYEGLQRIYERYRDDGLVVLGFPCNQFGEQEPEDDDTISDFVTATYGVTFPMFQKVDVEGESAHPLFKYLTNGGDPVHWNFEKFLIDRDGHVRARYASDVEPRDIVDDIDELI
ncbi:MAG: glutathione peroxidase [Peptoniphilus sp.]|nr:glutathione peroxidase [Peptoniphilus sp.]MDD7363700.1 glutathione peroxidase [Bacillota bacterium]MDY6044085.1 glutathione peroxidase [Peptoniphilus sp.]